MSKLGTYVAIAGNIGAGKSSFLEFLNTQYELKPVFEPNDENPFLEDYYADMARWGFHSQVYFLAAKLALHRTLHDHVGHVAQDRTIWEDAEIFARHLGRVGIMSEREDRTYRLMYESVQAELRPPDVMIYLRCSVRTLRRRIRSRGRAMEADIPVKYLKALHVLYEDWFERYDLSPKIVFETDKLDPVTDLVDCKTVVDKLHAFM